MIYILLGIKIDPYFQNVDVGLLYENLKKAQFLWCVQNNATFRVSKKKRKNGPIISTEHQVAHIVTFSPYYDFSG